jgi:hypothetical protein
MFRRTPIVWCRCISNCTYCQFVLSMRLILSLGAAGDLVPLHCFACSFPSLGSNMMEPVQLPPVDFASVAIPFTSTISASLPLCPASPISRSLLPQSQTSVLIPVRRIPFLGKSLASPTHCLTCGVNHCICENFTRIHSIGCNDEGPFVLRPERCWKGPSRVALT